MQISLRNCPLEIPGLVNVEFFELFDESIVMQLRMKSLGNCTEIASKTTKTSNFLTVQGQYEAFFRLQIELIS